MKRRVVVIGGGFGGLKVAKGLRHVDVEVTVVDRANHHLFQPLLYQVATAGLSPADIASPIRRIFRGQRNLSVIMGEVVGVDAERRTVLLQDGELPYDVLVFAAGMRDAYFMHPEWAAHAPGLKTLDDAVRIRRSILVAFEKAERTENAAERDSAMTFAIVGGGPTGVEMAGAIAELAHRALAADFDRINPRSARVLLIEAGPRVLAAFPESLSESALRNLAALGVTVRLRCRVEDVDARGLVVQPEGGDPERIEAETVVWAAGVRATPVGEWTGAQVDRLGRVLVGPDLTIPGHPDWYVIGDAAAMNDADGKPLPGVAQVAMQQGVYVARAIRGRNQGPFRYKDLGSMATIGRSRAVAILGSLKLTGFVAWVIWLFVHLMSLVRHRNRLTVLLQWAWAYLFWEQGARLITPIRSGLAEVELVEQEPGGASANLRTSHSDTDNVEGGRS